MLKAFFDKFKDELNDFTGLIEFLKSTETFKESKVNPLTYRIDQIIKEENYIVLHGDLNKLEVLKKEKIEMEELLSARKMMLKVIEKDYNIRIKAIGILELLIDNGGKLSDLRKALNDLWLLRAFILKVIIHSKHLYEIQWVDDDHSIVELEAGE